MNIITKNNLLPIATKISYIHNFLNVSLFKRCTFSSLVAMPPFGLSNGNIATISVLIPIFTLGLFALLAGLFIGYKHRYCKPKVAAVLLINASYQTEQARG